MAEPIISKRGVYAIECVDGRSYVGGAEYVVGRWGAHRFDLRRGRHRNHRLQSAWDTMGEEAFTSTLLERVPVGGDLREVEQRWLDKCRAQGEVFNLYLTAGSPKGTVHTLQMRARNAASQIGIQAGVKNANAKMTEDGVREIRRMAAAGKTHKEIAARYGTSRENVGIIVRRQRWSHVM